METKSPSSTARSTPTREPKRSRSAVRRSSTSSSDALTSSTSTAMPSRSGSSIVGRTSVSTVNSRSWPSSSGTAVTSTSGWPMARMSSASAAWAKKTGRASLTASCTTAPRPTRWSMIRLGTLPLRKPGICTWAPIVLYAWSSIGFSSANGTSTTSLTRVGLMVSTALFTSGTPQPWGNRGQLHVVCRAGRPQRAGAFQRHARTRHPGSAPRDHASGRARGDPIALDRPDGAPRPPHGPRAEGNVREAPPTGALEAGGHHEPHLVPHPPAGRRQRPRRRSARHGRRRHRRRRGQRRVQHGRHDDHDRGGGLPGPRLDRVERRPRRQGRDRGGAEALPRQPGQRLRRHQGRRRGWRTARCASRPSSTSCPTTR